MIGGQSLAWLHQKEPLSLRSKERARWTTNLPQIWIDQHPLYSSTSNDSRDGNEIDSTLTQHDNSQSTSDLVVYNNKAPLSTSDLGVYNNKAPLPKENGCTTPSEESIFHLPQIWINQHPLYNSMSNESRDRKEDNAVTNHAENPLDDVSIAVISIASEKEYDSNTNAAPHHCMLTLRDAPGSIMDTLDTIREDIVQEDTNTAP